MPKRRSYRASRYPATFTRPFTEAEDAALIDMAGCGLAVDFYPLGLPDRTLGEALDRRLELKRAGRLQLAALA